MLKNSYHPVKLSLFTVLVITILLTTAQLAIANHDVTVIAVQMSVSPEVYQTPTSFYNAIHNCMEKAKPHFGSGQNLVAFPEDIGLGLVLMGYYDVIQYMGYKSLEENAGVVAYCNIDTIGQIMAEKQCSLARALFIMRKPEIESVYHDVFASIAAEYGKYHITIVAGSAPIADEDGLVYNTSYIFGPGGVLLGRQRKVHLIDLEISKLDLASAPLEEIHSIDTPAGRVGIAICFDSFFDDVVDKLASEGTQILVQPSFNPGQWTSWQQNDWRKGTWLAVRKHRPLSVGVNPMMVGALYDIVPEGRSSITAFTPTGYLDRANTSDNEEIVWANVRLN